MNSRYARACRLTQPSEFRRVFSEPRRFRSQGFQLLVRPNSAGRARLGLAISKRCAKRAVDRNRLKRLIRESFRSSAARLPAVDIVVLCSNDVLGATNDRLRVALTKAFGAVRSHTWAASPSPLSGLTNISSVP